MESELSNWGILTIVAGAILSLVTALTTYLSVRAKMKTTEKQTNLEEDLAEVTATERLGNSYLLLVQALETQLTSCQCERRKTREEASTCRSELQEERLLRKRIVAKVRRLSEYHNSLKEDEISRLCPGFSKVQNILDEITEDLDLSIV